MAKPKDMNNKIEINYFHYNVTVWLLLLVIKTKYNQYNYWHDKHINHLNFGLFFSFLFHYTSEVCLNGTSTKGRTPGTFGGAGISSLITVGFSFVFVRNTTTASVINWKTNVKSNKNPRMPIEIIHINFGSGGVTNSAGKFRS